MGENKFIDIETLPCGCTLSRSIVDGERTLTLAPCRETCTVVADALAEADRQKLPVQFKVR